MRRFTANRAVMIPLLLLASTLPAAANLVQNPGFETGDFTGWTVGGDTSNFDVFTRPHTGSFDAEFGNFTFQGDSILSQSLATTAGTTYDISFWIKPFASPRPTTNASTSDPGNHMKVTFGSDVLMDMSHFFDASASDGYTNYQFTDKATSSATTISFAGFQNSGWVGLDDVSVTAAPVPEAGTVASFGLMLMAGGLGALRARGTRRRRP